MFTVPFQWPIWLPGRYSKWTQTNHFGWIKRVPQSDLDSQITYIQHMSSQTRATCPDKRNEMRAFVTELLVMLPLLSSFSRSAQQPASNNNERIIMVPQSTIPNIVQRHPTILQQPVSDRGKGCERGADCGEGGREKAAGVGRRLLELEASTSMLVHYKRRDITEQSNHCCQNTHNEHTPTTQQNVLSSTHSMIIPIIICCPTQLPAAFLYLCCCIGEEEEEEFIYLDPAGAPATCLLFLCERACDGRTYKDERINEEEQTLLLLGILARISLPSRRNSRGSKSV